MNNTCEEKLTTIEGYQFVRNDRQVKLENGQTKKGGGTGIYYKDKLSVNNTVFKHLNVSNPNIEMQWAVIERPHTKKILLAIVYRPPDGKAMEAVEILDQQLMNIDNVNNYEVLIMGDFNIDYKVKKNPPTTALKQIATIHELTQVIDKPTRITKNTEKTIDLAFTNMKYCTNSGTLEYNISDHKPIYII